MTDLGDGLTLVTHNGEGYRMVMRGGVNICHDGDVEIERNMGFCAAAGDVSGKTIAWIGGGFCLGARMMLDSGAVCTQEVYEIEPALRRFCPSGVAFAVGDWRDTLKAKYDVIIYDLAGEMPREQLSIHLAPGGVILPLL